MGLLRKLMAELSDLMLIPGRSDWKPTLNMLGNDLWRAYLLLEVLFYVHPASDLGDRVEVPRPLFRKQLRGCYTVAIYPQ